MITSPIVYMGGKTRLVKSGLIRMFPKDINRFVDVFSGSGCVAMNVQANSYQLNDIDDHIISLYLLFKNHCYSPIGRIKVP